MHSIVNCPAAHSGKNKALHQVPLRWRGAAQRRGGQRIQENATSLSLRAIADGVAISSVSLCSTMCRSGAYARLYYDWIATVTAFPRDDKKHRAKFPSVGGVPRSGGVVRVVKKEQHLCHCERSEAISFLLLCRSGAYAPCAYPRICSNCASACFHILGFIASHHRWRGNPVNYAVAYATHHLHSEL